MHFQLPSPKELNKAFDSAIKKKNLAEKKAYNESIKKLTAKGTNKLAKELYEANELIKSLKEEAKDLNRKVDTQTYHLSRRDKEVSHLRQELSEYNIKMNTLELRENQISELKKLAQQVVRDSLGGSGGGNTKNSIVLKLVECEIKPEKSESLYESLYGMGPMQPAPFPQQKQNNW
jgi:phage shock protein A